MEYPNKTANKVATSYLAPNHSFNDDHSRSSLSSLAEDIMGNLKQANAEFNVKDSPLFTWKDLNFSPQFFEDSNQDYASELHNQKDVAFAPSSEIDLSSKSSTFLNKLARGRKQSVSGPWIQNTFFHFPIGSAESQILPRRPLNPENDSSSKTMFNQLCGSGAVEAVKTPSNFSSSSGTLSPKSSYGSALSLNDNDWPFLSMAYWVPKPFSPIIEKNSAAQFESRNTPLNETIQSLEIIENDKTGVNASNKKTNFALPTIHQQRSRSNITRTCETLEHTECYEENYDTMLKMFLKKLTKKCGSNCTQKTFFHNTDQDWLFDEKKDGQKCCNAAAAVLSYLTELKANENVSKVSESEDLKSKDLNSERQALRNHNKKSVIDDGEEDKQTNITSLPMAAVKDLPITTKTTTAEIQTLIPSPHWTLPTLNSHVPLIHKVASPIGNIIVSECRAECPMKLQEQKNSPFINRPEYKENSLKECSSQDNSLLETTSTHIIVSDDKNKTNFSEKTNSEETLISFNVEEPQRTPPENLSQMSLLYKRSNISVAGPETNKSFSSETEVSKSTQHLRTNQRTNGCQHPSACKPCAFHWTKGCINGKNCQFCHEWHTPKKKKPMKEQKNLMIIARPDGKIEFLRCSVEEALRRS